MRTVVIAFYKFVALDDYEQMRAPLFDFCMKHDIRGTILLAKEGINSTIAGTREAIDAVLAYLKSDPRLSDLLHKESWAPEMPFYRMKVKLKREIVTMGVEGIDPTQKVGEYLNPKEWNELISDPDTILVDTRNDYEFETGKFRGAIDPNTKTFREFPAYVEKEMADKKDKKIAMYCTGGIRCEKATSYMLEQGFDKVYHLNGGILKYLEDMPEEDSMWEGECFVFDHRVALKHGLEQGSYDLCYGCQMPVTQEDKESEKYEEGIACPRCYDESSPAKLQKLRNRQHQVALCAERGEQHIGY